MGNEFGRPRQARAKLITDNLDSEYRRALALRNDGNFYLQAMTDSILGKSDPLPGGKPRPRLAHRHSTASFSVDRVFDVPHNPFRSRLAMETPQNQVELYQRFRFYYKYEPFVGAAIDTHANFPLSKFRLSHEDSVLNQEFNDIAEDLNLFEFMLDMAYEFYIVGECFPYGTFDDPKDPSVWAGFTLLNPIYTHVESAPIIAGKPSFQVGLKIDPKTRRVIENGPKHPQTGELYKRLPSDVIEAARTGGIMSLNPTQVSHFKRKGSYFQTRGESLLMRIMHLLSYRDRLRDAQMAISDRHATPREVWKVGESSSPASPEEIDALAEMISQSYLDPSQAVVWHHALQVEVIGGYDKIMPIRQEMEGIESEILTGLMLNKGFLDSNYGAYSNMSVSLDMLIARYIVFRTSLEDWQKRHVWEPLCRLHNVYKPTKAELDHKIRIKGSRKRPWVPDITWDKQELRDTNQKVQLMMQLRDKLGKPGFPRAKIYEAMNYAPDVIEELVKKEKEHDIAEGGTMLGAPMPGGAGGMPIPIPGGGPMGGPPAGGAERLNAPIGEVPSGGAPVGGGPGAQPPDAQNVMNSNIGTGNPGK